MTVLGHACRLSRTNTGGIVWVCECGEVGDVVPLIAASEELTQRSRRRFELTEGIAKARHGAHLEDVRLEHVAYSEKVLATLSTNRVAANATLQRRGRWGHS